MKKSVVSIALILLTVVMLRTLQAGVSGPCVNCHTMHNSQGGSPMAIQLNTARTAFEDDTTPNPALLISDCVGCHTNIGSATINNGVPIVFNADTPTPNYPLAGGNFRYVTTDDAKGHNVDGITGKDGKLGLTPPGAGGTPMGVQLRCAGEFGCHGDRTQGNGELDGIKGAHHTDDTGGITGESVGLSYRFLNGILGKEDGDWERDNDNTSHNEYQGATSFNNNTTISFLCGQCHGNAGNGGFHNPGGVGSYSPWLRHPTDIALKNTGEYADYVTYSMVAPVARPNPDSVLVPTRVTPGTDIIMCLSCHRAHGSPYFKLMRWDYKNWPPGNNGCVVCHTWKD